MCSLTTSYSVTCIKSYENLLQPYPRYIFTKFFGARWLFYQQQGNISSRFSSDSEANASESLENPEEMFLQNSIYSFVLGRFKYLTICDVFYIVKYLTIWNNSSMLRIRNLSLHIANCYGNTHTVPLTNHNKYSEKCFFGTTCIVMFLAGSNLQPHYIMWWGKVWYIYIDMFLGNYSSMSCEWLIVESDSLLITIMSLLW